jgi:uncharacterized membrane protein YidH (DUF202 family)
MGASTVWFVPIVVVLLLAGMALWDFQDASAHVRRGTPVRFTAGSIEVSTPVVWAVGCLFLWVIFMPLYITCRRQAS